MLNEQLLNQHFSAIGPSPYKSESINCELLEETDSGSAQSHERLYGLLKLFYYFQFSSDLPNFIKCDI